VSVFYQCGPEYTLVSTFFFSTFDMKKLGKIRRHHWKERPKIISKITNFESDLLTTNEDTTEQLTFV